MAGPGGGMGHVGSKDHEVVNVTELDDEKGGKGKGTTEVPVCA